MVSASPSFHSAMRTTSESELAPVIARRLSCPEQGENSHSAAPVLLQHPVTFQNKSEMLEGCTAGICFSSASEKAVRAQVSLKKKSRQSEG